MISILFRSMDSEHSADQASLMDKLRSGTYFKDRPVIITYGLLALAFILVIALFATVHSNHLKPERKEMASKDDILGVNITVNSLIEKMTEVERAAKKMSTCESGWQLFDRKCYFFSNTKTTWSGSRSMCIQKSADLVVINNENEQKFISGLTGSMAYWIGLSAPTGTANWTWVDGTDYQLSYMSWSPNEPNNSGGSEHCGQVWKKGNWNDKSCKDSNSFAICEKKL